LSSCFSLCLHRSTPDTRPFLLDDFVRSSQNIRRNCQADLLGSFQINNELKFLRLLHGEIGGLGAFEDLVYISGGAAIQIGRVPPVGH
jgi:hypothetical protein